MVPAKGVEAWKCPLGPTSTMCSGFSPRFGGEDGGFPGFRCIGKQTVKNVPKQVVHHKAHYGMLLVW